MPLGASPSGLALHSASAKQLGVNRTESQLFPALWTLGKYRITKTTYTCQSANHTDATARSLTVKRIKVGARNSRTDPSSQKRSPRLAEREAKPHNDEQPHGAMAEELTTGGRL